MVESFVDSARGTAVAVSHDLSVGEENRRSVLTPRRAERRVERRMRSSHRPSFEETRTKETMLTSHSSGSAEEMPYRPGEVNWKGRM